MTLACVNGTTSVSSGCADAATQRPLVYAALVLWVALTAATGETSAVAAAARTTRRRVHLAPGTLPLTLSPAVSATVGMSAIR